ncbi:MAG: sigma-70 family RNA polymerase sigma factor [Planctomycetota bacterium]
MTQEPNVSIEQLLEHREFLARLAGRLAADSAAAEDLVQDVWVKALSRPPASDENLRQWLAQVLKHHAFSTHRSRKSREKHETANAQHEDSQESSAAEAARQDLREFLAGAVLSLPYHERSVVILRFYSGVATEECARRLRIAPRTVRLRLSNALERLRHRIGDVFGGEAEEHDAP